MEENAIRFRKQPLIEVFPCCLCRTPVAEFLRRERKERTLLTNRQDLVKIKSRALRTKVWFRAISKVERAIIDLTIKCVDKIRSRMLAGTISAIVAKILQCLVEAFMTKADRVGHEIVERLCSVGERWGTKAFYPWKRDKTFIRFLGVNALNT